VPLTVAYSQRAVFVSGEPRALKRAFQLLIAVALCVAWTSPVLGGGHVPRRPSRLGPDARIEEVRRSASPSAAGAIVDGFEVVGHSTLAGFGTNPRSYGDVWGHGDFAYVGSSCNPSYIGGAGVGVRVVDISDPSQPVLISILPGPRFGRTEDVVVRDVSTPSFTGALAVVGIQQCPFTSHQTRFTGLKFFDVRDPSDPVLLSKWRLRKGSFGCHEIDAVQRPGGRVVAGCARNFVDQADLDAPGVQFVDATNPRHPVRKSAFSLPVEVFSGVGCDQSSFGHSVRFVNRGRGAYVSYWDAGTIRLGIRNLSRPKVLARTRIVPPDEDGDNHSMTPANGGHWIVINPEDFSPFGFCASPHPQFNGWGEAYIYERSEDAAHPFKFTYLGTFATPNTHSTRTDGAYTIHNTEVVSGREFFSSWYTDGVVWWTMNDVGVSEMKAQFVPPKPPDADPLVWGVYPSRSHDVILASDITMGLWILRPEGLGDF
jgi:hypothetical protein